MGGQMTDYFEEGHELYLREPDLMLIEVYRRALSAWTDADREAFLMGYIAMRRQRDERTMSVSAHNAREQEQDS